MAIQRTDHGFVYHKRGGHDIIFEVSDEDLSSDPTYFGYLSVDGSWVIQERNATNGTYRYAMGTSDYKTATTGHWAVRAGKTYVHYNEL